jgi:hypothetical protein
MYSFKYNQYDATLYNIIYYWQCSTCFRLFLRPLSGAKNFIHSIWYMSSLLVTAASGSSKQAWHIPDAVYTVLSSWWWVKKPPETCGGSNKQAWHIPDAYNEVRCCSGKATSITYCECVSVALLIQHAMRMRHIVFYGLLYFSTLSHIRHDFIK